jgi:hypothetical protein
MSLFSYFASLWGGKDLEKRREKHLERLRKQWEKKNAQPCRHRSCSQCFGTGIKFDGTPCIHYISCPCDRCTPYSM